MQTLTQWLYVISNSLLIPVVLLLLAFGVWAIVLMGGFLREWAERRKVRKCLSRAVQTAARDDSRGEEIWRNLRDNARGLPARLCRSVGDTKNDQALFAKALEDLENDVTEATAKLSFLTRVGPMLGLMGTLIPLGPALTALAGGNVQELSSNLIVAFTTTVVGLLISGLCYGMGLARRIWYERDMSDLEFVVQRLGRWEESK